MLPRLSDRKPQTMSSFPLVENEFSLTTNWVKSYNGIDGWDKFLVSDQTNACWRIILNVAPVGFLVWTSLIGFVHELGEVFTGRIKRDQSSDCGSDVQTTRYIVNEWPLRNFGW